MIRRDFNALTGKTLQFVVGLDNRSEKVVFTTVDGEQFEMYHENDCCEMVDIEDVIGDVADILGNPILFAEEVTHQQENPPDVPVKERQDSFTWTFYRIGTVKGALTIRWYGESNGYYSEDVSFFGPELADEVEDVEDF